MSNPNTTHIRMQVRIPFEVHAALVAAREESDRSLNGEIVSRLRASFGKRFGAQPSAKSEGTDILKGHRSK